MTQMEKLAITAQYETIQLESGLTVLVHPMPGFSSVHAIYATKFGSIDRDFVVDGKEIHLPAGVAHFLEHKMFECEDGDAFEKYAKTGANANAYTSFDKTAYIFTASEKIDESLDILLSMVGQPYFTEETIAKEQGIIGQEIKMYDDSVDWRMMMALFQGLYQKHSIRDDIAGSVESISQITPEMLYACCDAFYQQGNMVLVLAGNIAREQVLAAAQRAGLSEKRPSHTVKRLAPQEPKQVMRKYYEFSMPISKVGIGLAFKEQPIAEGDLKRDLIYQVLPELICGGMTPLYRRLYDEGIVNPEFDGEALALDDCCCVLFTGESDQPDRLLEELNREITRIRTEGVDEELFTLVKNQLYGEAVSNLESVVDTASSMMAAFLKGHTMQDELQALASLTKQDVDSAMATMLLPECGTVVKILPQEA